MKTTHILFICSCAVASLLQAQEDYTVQVNLDVQHSVNGVSEFDRSKFIILHADIDDNEWDSDAQRKQFLEDYDVYLGRNNGGMVWEFNQSEEDDARSGWPDISVLQQRGATIRQSYGRRTSSHEFENRYENMMYGGQPIPLYPNGRLTSPNACCSQADPWAYEGYDAIAEYYAYYLKEFFGTGGTGGKPRPQYVEVLNEPFVKSNTLGTTNANITEMHKTVAQRIKAVNPNVKVGGYSAAHPAYESGNFNHWRNNWELFIDGAGEDMDFFSLHLYDFNGTANVAEEDQRKGSNVEAILDMVEHYSFLKLEEVKPFSISEYGWLGREFNGPYNKERDWFNLRSFSSMMMQLMERQDRMVSAIPFMILKARWWQSPGDYGYSYRLLRQKKDLAGETGDEYVYTEFVKFFELWSQVKGTRVDTYSNDPDILTDAYVDGNKAYVILSNLEHEAVNVDLQMPFLSNSSASEIKVKHLFANASGTPILEENIVSSLDEFNIGKEATAIIEYTFGDVIEATNEVVESKYYATTYLQSISGGRAISFDINNVQLNQFGEAVLRIGVGRDHGRSLFPILTVNGQNVSMVDDWKGYDQNTRDSFFGVLEVPVPFELLEANNEIGITFPDSGGNVSSLSMQVFNFQSAISRELSVNGVEGNIPSFELKLSPNPFKSKVIVEGINTQDVELQLFDLSGKMLLKKAINTTDNEIDVQGIEEGVYMFRISVNGKEQTTKMIKL